MYIKDKKIIISAAITGATHVPSLSKYLPKNPDEIICSAIEAWRAGAAVVHVHARAQDGKPTTDHGIFRYILSSISQECDAVIGITTGGANGMSVEERFSVIEEFRPELASANGGSMNFCYNRLLAGVEKPEYDWEKEYVERTWDNVFRNSFRDMEYCIRTMNACKTLPEYEIFDYGQLNNLKILKKQGIITQPVYIQFVPGVQGGMPANNETLMFMIDQAKKILGNDIQYSSVGVGRKMFKLEVMSALNGGNVRVGMEDGLYMNPAGRLAESNAQQVEKIKTILEALDFEIADSNEARRMLHLKGKEHVNF
ncbi:3-keto-5-aminohexanoate cleavage protein [Eisenbergiella sp.]